MAKKPKIKETEEIEEIEETEGEEPEEEIEEEIEEPVKGTKKKHELFPKELPPSEPPPKPKVKKSELDAISTKMDELGQKVEKLLTPKVIEKKESGHRWFDEFDITLGKSDRDAET